MFTKHQQIVFDKILAHAHTYFKGSHQSPCCLLTGPSGYGKSYITKHIAESLNCNFLSMATSGWIIPGARTDATSEILIEIFKEDRRPIVLFLDEFDKFAEVNSDWHRSVLMEILLLLDGNLRPKLRGKVFTVVGGAWHNLHVQAKGALDARGLATQDLDTQIYSTSPVLSYLPPEIASRLGIVYTLPTPTDKEILDISKNIGLTSLATQYNVHLPKAEDIAFNGGYRFIRNIHTKLVIHNWEATGQSISHKHTQISSSSDQELEAFLDRCDVICHPPYKFSKSDLRQLEYLHSFAKDAPPLPEGEATVGPEDTHVTACTVTLTEDSNRECRITCNRLINKSKYLPRLTHKPAYWEQAYSDYYSHPWVTCYSQGLPAFMDFVFGTLQPTYDVSTFKQIVDLQMLGEFSKNTVDVVLYPTNPHYRKIFPTLRSLKKYINDLPHQSLSYFIQQLPEPLSNLWPEYAPDTFEHTYSRKVLLGTATLANDHTGTPCILQHTGQVYHCSPTVLEVAHADIYASPHLEIICHTFEDHRHAAERANSPLKILVIDKATGTLTTPHANRYAHLSRTGSRIHS